MLEPSIQDKRRWWSWEHIIVLVLLGMLYFLPGLAQIPLVDRDEPRFAVAARTMAQTGDYIVPMFNGALRPDKPPLIYWLMDVTTWATGGWGDPSEIGPRLPSAICSTLTLLVVYFMVGSRFGRLTGLVAAMMLGSCVLFTVIAHMATADATMIFFIVTCMACAWQAWDAGAGVGDEAAEQHLPRTDYLLDRSARKPAIMLDHLPRTERRHMSWALALLFWVALAGGMLTKGVPLFFVLVPMVVLSLATGTLPEQLRKWRSHLHVTRVRMGLALCVGAIASAVIVTAFTSAAFAEWGWSAGVLGLLLIGMLLTPGLPGVFFRCLSGGNWGWWRELRPLVGVPLLILLVGWWVLLVGLRTHGEFLYQMVGVHFLERVAGPLFQALHIQLPAPPSGAQSQVTKYAKPPGYYLAVVWATFWPWSILLVPAAYHTFRRMMSKTAIAIDPRPYQFLVAWIVPMWILLELSRGKLFHYPLPLYVGLSILCADALVQSWHRLTDVFAAKWFEMMKWIVLAIWIGMAAALLVGAKMSGDHDLLWRCVPLAGALIAAGVAGLSAWGGSGWPFVTVLAWGGVLLFANALLLPDVNAVQASRLAGRRMAELKKAEPDFQMLAAGYQEPTLVFYAGQNLLMPSLPELLRKNIFSRTSAPPSGPKYVMTVDQPVYDLLRSDGYQVYALRRVSGINMGNFKPVQLTVITNFPPRSWVSSTAPASPSH